MSYCRWSHGSDVYVYGCVSVGWTTCVANRTYLHPSPYPKAPDGWRLSPANESMALFRSQQEWYRDATQVPIGGPMGGQIFHDDTPGECADRLEELKRMGYQVPQSVIDTLRAEDKG